MKRFAKWLLAAAVMLCITLLHAQAQAAVTYPNAAVITYGETYTGSLDAATTEQVYKFTTTAPGQFLQLDMTATASLNWNVIDASTGNGVISGYLNSASQSWIRTLPNAGEYYLRVYGYGSTLDYTLTAALADNDANEPNNSADTATALTSGVKTDIVLGGYDYDFFTITTTKDAQDIALSIGGFDYTSTGYVNIRVDNKVYNSFTSNETRYFHAAKAGKHTIELWYNYDLIDDYTITATVLDGDANEPNDTLDAATRLLIGTDAKFVLGGWGDEDWFTFEAAPEAGQDAKLYTLNFLDLNTDYSDKLLYDVYAPDGTTVSSGSYVNMRHAKIIACDQTGLYAVRVYTDPNNYNNGSYMTISRSTLRIRVDEGGADPYEDNNTWLKAAAVGTGTPLQFELSNTADDDWFRFEVPEADMTLEVESDSKLNYYLYSAESLQANGTDSYLDSYDGRYGSYPAYYKFTNPGTYYICFTTSASYATTDLRTVTLNLLPATEEENNDTWKTAKPIYEGVPQKYTVSAPNDYDWFKLEVPQGVSSLVIQKTYHSGYVYLYRQADFETAGDGAASVAYDWGTSLLTYANPAAGTYYIKLSGVSVESTITYALTYDGDAFGSTIDTATPVQHGEWMTTTADGYIALGELKAGDEVRVKTEGVGNVYLYDSTNTYLDGFNTSDRYTHTFVIPADGSYYFRVNQYTDGIDADGEAITARIRCDIGNSGVPGTAIENLPDSITLEVGETYQLDPRVYPYDADMGRTLSGNAFDYYESAWSIAEADSYGQITAGAVGTSTVTVYTYSNNENRLSHTITVNVVEPGTAILPTTPATAVTISNAPTTMSVGEKTRLTATLAPADSDDTVTWASSDEKILYVNAAGTVTAVGSGTATITATAQSGVKATAIIVVSPAAEKVPVSGLTLNDYDLTLYAGEETVQLAATVRPENAEYDGVKWNSSNVDVATVDQQGNITPVGPGITVVTASAGSYKASCIVTVQAARVRVESIAFDQTTLEIPMGGESTLIPVITPSNATVKTSTWVSSDERVATVSRTGIVTAIAVGETTVTVTTLDGQKSASITIVVTASAQLGDINMDGYIDAGDALLTLRYAVGSITLTTEQLAVADVNKDGYVDAGDAIRILRFNAGLIESL